MMSTSSDATKNDSSPVFCSGVSSVHNQGLPVLLIATEDCDCEEQTGVDYLQSDGTESIGKESTEPAMDSVSNVQINMNNLVISDNSATDSQLSNTMSEENTSTCTVAANVDGDFNSELDVNKPNTLPLVSDDSSIKAVNSSINSDRAADANNAVKDRDPIADNNGPTGCLVDFGIGDRQQAVAGSSTSKAAVKEADVAHTDTGVQQQSVYQIKWVKWKDSKVPVITQNENGPCPLIAVMNVLLLLGKVKLSYSVEIITSDQLMEYLGDCILDSAPKNISEGAQLNYEQNMHDAIAVLPKMQTGLDVNVKFTGVHDFEYTPECIIFDLLNIPLYHGWLVDPQAHDIVAAVGKLSYNQLVEKIITNKSSPNCDLVTEALIAENFLEKSASQLTYYGLCELNEVLKANEVAILFRNNHFCTVFKHDAELLQLVTDQGFLNESNVVWETLSNIEGDCQFVDANFVTVPPKAVPITTAATAASAISIPVDLDGEEQIQHDYLVALSLQEEQKREEEKAKMWQEYKEKELGVTDGMTDEELARRLHADEQRLANERGHPEEVIAAPTDNQNPSPASGASATAANRLRQSSTESKSAKQDKKKSDCTIL